MSTDPSPSRHSSASSNYDNAHDYSASVIKPKLESIETSSASSNKSPAITDSLPPSNLSDIESVDDRKGTSRQDEEAQHDLHIVNPDLKSESNINKTPTVNPSSSTTTTSSSATQNRSQSPAPSANESIQTRDYQQTVGVKLSQLQDTSSLESLLAKPIHQQPSNLTRASNRASVFSNISQYSGGLESSAQAVPVVLQRSDSTKIKKVKNKKARNLINDASESKSVNTDDSAETMSHPGKPPLPISPLTQDTNDADKDEEGEVEDEISDYDESDYDESSILMGKLPTTNAPDTLQLNPDKTFETNVEGAIPARSPRRPTSMLPPGTNSADIVGVHQTNKAARRKTMHITDNLDRLMQDASSMSTFSSEKLVNEPAALQQNIRDDDVAVYDTTGPHDDVRSETESRGPEVPSHRYSTGTSSTKMTPLLKTLAVEDEDIEVDDEIHSSLGNESDNITIPKRDASLPPRPSEDDIRRARNVSTNLQKQQKQQQQQQQQQQQHEEGLQIEGPDHGDGYYVNDENPEFDDGYYDIDEPIRHPSRGKSVKNSIRRPARDITNTTTNNVAAPASGTTAISAQEAQHQQQSKDLKKPPSTRKHKRHSKEKAKSQRGGGHTRGSNLSSSVTGAATSGHSAELKPFSYKTLVSLLESMNGTIIGEEFATLNIPIREKQLIEKIIDSLSRLSSDMILDRERYDAGIQRLERALRVLEGFN
ncbi:hypothetical protein KGF57_002963 [Candida theae]|uniref:Uncharacterized protein n=1 Tax=Candida theae TaxID=1198502 RepID=A0AAD5FY79_9ASCO|nr:uncharacterized protein KGF57_002963 [Candida theae]KAI5957697.1 hypothetical protein KGF57_002963 [Candida theae]